MGKILPLFVKVVFLFVFISFIGSFLYWGFRPMDTVLGHDTSRFQLIQAETKTVKAMPPICQTIYQNWIAKRVVPGFLAISGTTMLSYAVDPFWKLLGQLDPKWAARYHPRNAEERFGFRKMIEVDVLAGDLALWNVAHARFTGQAAFCSFPPEFIHLDLPSPANRLPEIFKSEAPKVEMK